MNSAKISILEFPSNLGLKKKESDRQLGVAQLPGWLRKHLFHQLISPEQIVSLTPPPYSLALDQVSGVRNAENIRRYAIDQANVFSAHLKQEHFLLCIGGDCSILIGNALALKQQGTYGLFFLDGHTDFMWPSMSQTGGVAGMDLAIVTGYGHDKLTNILHQKPYFQETHVWCVGNREYEPDYVKPITESNITYYDLHKLRQEGTDACAASFLTMIEKYNLDGFFIHLDVDVLDDEIMPAVDSRQTDGLSYPEFTQLLSSLLLSPKAMGMEITILDPTLDPQGIYTKEFVTHLVQVIQLAKKTTGN